MLNIYKTILSLVIVTSCVNAGQDPSFNKCNLTGCGCVNSSCNDISSTFEKLQPKLNLSNNYSCIGGSYNNNNIQNSEFYKLQQEFNKQGNSKEKNSEYKKQFSSQSKIEMKNNTTKINLSKNYEQPVKNKY